VTALCPLSLDERVGVPRVPQLTTDVRLAPGLYLMNVEMGRYIYPSRPISALSPSLCECFRRCAQASLRTISATFSPIAIVVKFVFALMQSGMIDASATRRPPIP